MLCLQDDKANVILSHVIVVSLVLRGIYYCISDHFNMTPLPEVSEVKSQCGDVYPFRGIGGQLGAISVSPIWCSHVFLTSKIIKT
jgi:hypothetical protein